MATVACNANLDAVFEDECLGDSLPKINSNFNSLQQILWSLRERVDSRVEVRTFFYYGPNAAGPVGSKASGQLSVPGKGARTPQLSPAGESPAGSGMDDNQTTRPSNLTIEAFVNSSSQINLPSISEPGDIAYVIYQKTGFLSSILQNIPFASQQDAVIASYINVYDNKGNFIGIQPTTVLAGTATATRTPGYVTIKGRVVPSKAGNISVTTTAGNSVSQWITTDDIVMQLSPVFVVWRLTCSNQLAYLVDQGYPKFHRAQTPSSVLWDQPQLWSQFTEYV